MSDVVLSRSSSVEARYQTHQDEVPATRQALYDKLKHADLPVPVALIQDLQSEIDPLGYPKAALLSFCGALRAYNVVALVKGAVAAAWGHSFLQEELSMYYLTLEVERVTAGMQIAVGPEDWAIFRTMAAEQFAATLRTGAAHRSAQIYQVQSGPGKETTPGDQW